jgi:hypothetical protein
LDKIVSYIGLFSDGNSLRKFLETINKIVASENEIQRDFASVAFYHVNAEQIRTGR